MRKKTAKVLLLTIGYITHPFARLRNRYCSSKVLHSPIFIVGAPRTGSTVLYQALTNQFNVAYIDNLAGALFRNLPLGIWLSRVAFGRRPHNTFKADFGNTQRYGWHAPSECGQFWYRWLPLEYHFLDEGEFSSATVSEIQSEINRVQSVVKGPLLFKNLNAGQRLRLLAKAFPGARIIYLTRDPRFTAASIVRARRSNNIAVGQWWSIKPKNFRELINFDEAELAMAQVFHIESQIAADLALFQDANVRIVHYNDLSQELVESLGRWLGLTKRTGGSTPEFAGDTAQKMSSAELAQLTQLAEKYPFAKDSFV